MKTKPHNPLDKRELRFDSPLDFRLMLDATEDGERVSTERQEREAARLTAERAQRLFDGMHKSVEGKR